MLCKNELYEANDYLILKLDRVHIDKLKNLLRDNFGPTSIFWTQIV